MSIKCTLLATLIRLACMLGSGQQFCAIDDRFEWPVLAPLTFSPSVGHLPAGAVKDIVVVYLSDKPIQLKAAVAALKAAQLKLPAGAAASDWDNRIAPGSSAAVPEPKLELASAKEAPPVSLPLKVSHEAAANMLGRPAVEVLSRSANLNADEMPYI